MVSQELATAVTGKVPIKIMLLNNGYLGMVRQWQELFYNRRYSETCIKNCNLVLIDFWIEMEENVFPMVAPGEPINKMLEDNK